MSIEIFQDDKNTRVVIFDEDTIKGHDFQAIFNSAPKWANKKNAFTVRVTAGTLVNNHGDSTVLFLGGRLAVIWERNVQPIETIVTTDDLDYKLVVMALEEYNSNSAALDGLAPDWATPDNFKFNKSTDSTIKDGYYTIGLAQVNAIAFLWERKGRIVTEGWINPYAQTVINSR